MPQARSTIYLIDTADLRGETLNIITVALSEHIATFYSCDDIKPISVGIHFSG